MLPQGAIAPTPRVMASVVAQAYSGGLGLGGYFSRVHKQNKAPVRSVGAKPH